MCTLVETIPRQKTTRLGTNRGDKGNARLKVGSEALPVLMIEHVHAADGCTTEERSPDVRRKVRRHGKRAAAGLDGPVQLDEPPHIPHLHISDGSTSGSHLSHPACSRLDKISPFRHVEA